MQSFVVVASKLGWLLTILDPVCLLGD